LRIKVEESDNRNIEKQESLGVKIVTEDAKLHIKRDLLLSREGEG